MSVNFNLDRFELQTLSEAAINHPNPIVRQRAASLYWIYYGYSESNLPTTLLRHSTELHNWIADYEEFGIAGMITSFATQPSRAVLTA